jgi:predicted deacylase
MSDTRPSRLSATIDLNRNGKHVGFVRLPHSVHRSAYGWLPIPIVSIRNGDGPKVLLNAGNHGDEWEGQVALGKLIRELRPSDIRGQVIILPSSNFPAAMAGTRTSPIDDGNLNRSFPGNPDGTVTQQIAYYIEHVLLPGCNFAFDFHSGGSSLMYLPSSLCGRDPDPERFERALERLRVFGAPIGYFSSKPQQTQGEDRTLSAGAMRKGVETMGTELGGTGKVTPSILKVAEDGIKRLLAHVGVYKGKVPPPPPVRLVEVGGDDYFVYAPDGGVFEPLAEIGAEVKKGQPAALIHFHDTPWRKPSLARFARDGLVLCMRVPGRTERGDCLFHLGTDYTPPRRAGGGKPASRKRR